MVMMSMFCGHVPRGYIQFLPRVLHFSAVHYSGFCVDLAKKPAKSESSRMRVADMCFACRLPSFDNRVLVESRLVCHDKRY